MSSTCFGSTPLARREVSRPAAWLHPPPIPIALHFSGLASLQAIALRRCPGRLQFLRAARHCDANNATLARIASRHSSSLDSEVAFRDALMDTRCARRTLRARRGLSGCMHFAPGWRVTAIVRPVVVRAGRLGVAHRLPRAVVGDLAYFFMGKRIHCKPGSAS